MAQRNGSPHSMTMTHISAFFIFEGVGVRVSRNPFYCRLAGRLCLDPVCGWATKGRRMSTGDGSISGGPLAARIKRCIAKRPVVVHFLVFATRRKKRREEDVGIGICYSFIYFTQSLLIRRPHLLDQSTAVDIGAVTSIGSRSSPGGTTSK